MSAKATGWAWSVDGLSPAEKITLLAIADQADADGTYASGMSLLSMMTGAAYTTVSRHLAKFEERGLLSRATREIRLKMSRATRGSDSRHASEPRVRASGSGEKERKEDHPRGRTVRDAILPKLPLGVDIPDDMFQDAVAFLKAKRKVGGKIITPEEMLIAAAAMAEFNRQAETHQGLASSLTPIIGRIRDRPSWDAEKHVRLVQSAFRIRWWERNGRRGGRLTPAVIYGNERCFENVAMDAADEKAGKPKEIEKRRGRFRRTRSVEED